MIYTKVEMNIFARHAMNTALDNIIDHKSISITSDKLHQRLPYRRAEQAKTGSFSHAMQWSYFQLRYPRMRSQEKFIHSKMF